jgi:hypothetical protein
MTLDRLLSIDRRKIAGVDEIVTVERLAFALHRVFEVLQVGFAGSCNSVDLAVTIELGVLDAVIRGASGLVILAGLMIGLKLIG